MTDQPTRVTTQALEALIRLHEGWHVCKNFTVGSTDYDETGSDSGMGPCPTLVLAREVLEELRVSFERGEIRRLSRTTEMWTRPNTSSGVFAELRRRGISFRGAQR